LRHTTQQAELLIFLKIQETKMTTKKTSSPARTASFVQVAQPNYDWSEFEAENEESRVILPTGKDDRRASIVTPSHDTPAARAVRAHELLHARYTPDVISIAKKLTKHGVSPTAINYAEDIRLSKIANDRGLYQLVDGHFNDDVVQQYLTTIACRHGVAEHERRAHFNTGKAVQAAIGLIPHPVESGTVDKTSVKSILEAVEVRLGGDNTWSKVDIDKAQALFDEARASLAEIEARTYKGSKAIDAHFVDLANTIEDVLRRAYEVDEPPKGGEGGEGEGEGKDESPSEGASGGAGDEPKDEAKEEPKEEPKKEKSKPKNSKPDLKDKGASPLKDVLPPQPKTKRPTPVTRSEIAEAAERVDYSPPRDKPVDQSRDEPIRAGVTGEDREALVSSTALLEDYSLQAHWAGWGACEILMAPLVRSKKVLVPRRGKAGPDGTIPRHFHRWFSDREILDARGRRPGGTLLIDGSGSMNWSAERTRRLIDICPALTVAVYAGRPGNQSGVLTILARNGRACDAKFDYKEAHNHGYGNVVDGPALEWLCKQAGPRVWFCDGAVTGKGDWPSVHGYIDAYRLACAGQVTRTVELDTVIELLAGKIRPFPVSPGFVAALQEARDGGRRDYHTPVVKYHDACRAYEHELAQARRAYKAA
jgi:hypothetical protein